MRNRAFWIRAAIGVCLLIAVALMVDIRAAFQVLRNATPAFCVAVIVLAACDRVCMALKWTVLARAVGLRISWLESIRTYFASSFVGMFLPTSVGGDILRLFIAGVDRNARDRLAASIVVERILGFVALILLLVVTASTALFIYSYPGLGAVVIIAAAILLISLGVFAATLYHDPGWLIGRLKGRVGEFLAKLISAYRLYGERRGALLLFTGLSFFEHMIPVLCNYYAAMALGVKISPLVFFVIIPLTLVFARLPISLDGLGIQEGLYVLLFKTAGLAAPESFAIAILARILTMAALLPGGIMFMLHPVRNAGNMEVAT